MTGIVIQGLDIGKQVQVLRDTVTQAQGQRCAATQVERAQKGQLTQGGE